MSLAQHEPFDVTLATVSSGQREKNRKILQPILVDLIAYSLNLKQLHWNVIGPNFRPIHLHLDEIYVEAQEAVDVVAERLSAIGYSPDGTVKRVTADTEIGDVPEGFTHDKETLLLAEHRTRQVIGLIRSRMAEIEEVDTVTADLLHQIVGNLEKHHWMLQAQRE